MMCGIYGLLKWWGKASGSLDGLLTPWECSPVLYPIPQRQLGAVSCSPCPVDSEMLSLSEGKHYTRVHRVLWSFLRNFWGQCMCCKVWDAVDLEIKHYHMCYRRAQLILEWVENKSYSGGKAVTQMWWWWSQVSSPDNSSFMYHMPNSIFPWSLECGIIWGIKILCPVQKINGYLWG